MVNYDKNSPFLADLLRVRTMNLPGSTKKNLEIICKIDSSQVKYHTGDSCGIYPFNEDKEIYKIVDLLGLNKDSLLPNNMSVYNFMKTKVDLYRTSAKLASLTVGGPLTKESLESTVYDSLSQGGKISSEEFFGSLLPLLPRFFSISSSPLVDKNEIHMMVACFNRNLSKGYINSRAGNYLENNKVVPLFVKKNNLFKTPKDDRPILLIGPGTGIAALRGFLRERTRKDTKNWLFTGDRNYKYDFYYKQEFDEMRLQNRLKITTAFSRDGNNKVYVQDRIYEVKEEFWSWLTEGANCYISGGKAMARAIKQTLIDISVQCGNMEVKQATEFVERLKKEQRLLFDIY